VFSESNLQVTADTLMGLAPALVGVPTLIVSYLSGVVLLRKYYNTEWRSRMTRAACTLDISPAAAVIYVLCMVLVIFINKQSVFLMAITNMFFLLMPALALTGVNVVLFNARRAQGWVGKASVVLLVAAACCMGINCLYFLALWGAYVIVSSALHQKILQKMKDQNEK
jgi:cytochrome bd-type quinol oxidase subunit 2